MADVLLMDRSRIYRDQTDDAFYRSNLLYDMIREWSFLARVKGNRAKEYIQHCNEAHDVESQKFHAYFAGVAAREAFSVAARILGLDEERQKYLSNKSLVGVISR